MKGQYKFTKKEHIKSSIRIKEVMDNGEKVFSHPLIIQFSMTPPIEAECRAAFIVSKRRFKRAVDRNKIKRLMKEAYRLNINSTKEILENQQLSLDMTIIFVGKEIPILGNLVNGLVKCFGIIQGKITTSEGKV